MKTKYTSIRVPVEVADRLREYARDIEEQAAQNSVQLPDIGNQGKAACPLWFALEKLLDRVQSHRKRSAMQRRLRNSNAADGGGAYTHV